MNYSDNKKYIFGSIVLVLALVFIVGVAQPSTAHACYDGSCPQYYPPVYYPPVQVVIPPLYVSCYPQPLTASVGSNVTWASSVSGGTGSYTYTWSGSNGNFGNGGSSLSTVYYSPGNYSAYLTVTSGGQTQSASCSGSVTIYGNSYSPTPEYPVPIYTTPTYNYNTYSPLQVSCVPNAASTVIGSPVTWTANVVGGTYYSGYNNYNYSYSWSGTDGISGYSQSISVNYSTPGQKLAYVTVSGNGQTITQSCGSVVNVNGYGYGTNYIINSNSSNNSGLDIGCYADPVNATINQPITWSTEVTGGVAPYTYSWTGSDGLSGSGSSIIKIYGTSGQKSAIVTVTSADGKTGTRACSNTLAVGRPAGSYVARATTNTTVTTPVVNSNQTNNGQSAAALFSLQSVPWGWVAILVILVLFATVLYLIFNRPKI